MASPTNFPGDIVVPGTVTANRFAGAVSKDSLDSESQQLFDIPLVQWRRHDDRGVLIATAGTDDLGITTGTFGTDIPYITTGDFKTTTIQRRMGATIKLPQNYVDAQPVSLRFRAAMVTTVSDGACTLDVEAFLVGSAIAVSGTDLVTTAAQSLKTNPAGTFADFDFALTATNLTKTSFIDVRVTIDGIDAATGTAVIGAIVKSSILCTARG